MNTTSLDKLLLGIDLGTSACKVCIFNLDGRVIGQASKPYPVYYPAPDFVEQNPVEWWQAICEAIKEVLHKGAIQPGSIAGIGIDGQSWSCLPVDREGKPLRNAMIWMDRRAVMQSQKTVDKLGFKRIFAVSGNSFDPTYITPKILWLKENQPRVYDNTYKFLQSNAYIAFKLTGTMTQDLSQGYGFHVFNVKTGTYDSDLCEDMGIELSKLPDIFNCHDVIGHVTKQAAEATGLVMGIPVVAGGLDAACGTLGAGVIEFGQTQEQGGQAGGMSICLNQALAHPKLILSSHVIPNAWLLQGGTVGGGSLKWFKQELGAFEALQEKTTGENAFDLLVNQAAGIKDGSEGVIFLPYMAGERSPIWDKNAKGVFFGLGYDKTRGHMVRSILEGCAYALHHNLNAAEEVGVQVNELIAMGGAANSNLWTQIKANVTGKVIKVPSSDTATTLGAAMLAGVGTGLYRDFKEAVHRTVSITRVHEPDMKAHRVYQKYYEVYREIYEKLKDTFAKGEV
ncbi:FGGY-family carbohydrate kinase [Pelosinus sp. UFO1]|uniref:xylulokinase n=1 Tax=Pelosinus sp. UFO1 TaxID=484770 RepID=UPI0004D1F7F1|nr:FGGY-family carbohydrate kinase [Pelosinus sp. UFO1]AIF52533.1 Xylulokinase [Pelosinus sp. UFO1]